MISLETQELVVSQVTAMYGDDFIMPNPFFGLAGLDLRERILPALCGPMGRVLPEPGGRADD